METGLYYIDTALTGVAASYAKAGLIAEQIAPPVVVQKQTGKIWVKDPTRSRQRITDSKRAPGGESKPLFDENPTTISYYAEDHSYSSLLPDELREQIDVTLEGEIDKVENLIETTLLEQEMFTVSAIKSALTTAGQTDSPTVKFDDYDTATGEGSDPIVYITSMYDAVESGVGVTPNMLALSAKVARALVNHPKFQERARYTLPPAQNTSGLEAAQRLISQVLNLDYVYIATGASAVNTASKGKDTPVLTQIWGEEMFLGYKENPSLEYAGTALTLKYQASGGQSVNGVLIERERVPRRKSDEFFSHKYYDVKVINGKAGFWFTDLLT